MSFWDNELDKLVGLKVTGTAAPFNQGDETIEFITDKGNFKLLCYGDCCSHSWFEHAEFPEFPFVIQKAEEVEGADIPESDEYECLKTYGFKMTTSKGYLDIDMRNSSNGYYGGSFELDLSNLELQ